MVSRLLHYVPKRAMLTPMCSVLVGGGMGVTHNNKVGLFGAPSALFRMFLSLV